MKSVMDQASEGKTERERRSAWIGVFVVFFVMSGLVTFAGLAGAVSTRPLPAPDEKRGLRYGGLERPVTGRCKDTFKLTKADRCSHGPDPVPDGVDLMQDRPPVAAGSPTGSQAGADSPQTTDAASATAAGVACDGDGSSGKRFQAIYARASDRPDRYSTYVASIAQWAATADRVFADSAAQTGGMRRMRWVTDAACNLSVSNVTLTSTGDDNFDNTINQLYGKGFNRLDRKYVIWMDANVYCGIGTVDIDDTAGPGNANNTGPAYARTDSGCWGLRDSVEAHEIMHTIGGVQRSAPHSTSRLNTTDPGTFHCFDESDRMCYKDAEGVTLLSSCNDPLKEALFDCQSDDYFHTAPPPGNYLASHWNPAGSDFLIKSQPQEQQSGRYTGLPPARILDTRTGTGGISGTVGPGQTISLAVTGAGGVPSTGVSAVMLNVAVTQPSSASHLTVFPSGISPPSTANLNFAAGQTTSNLVVAKVGSNGRVSVLNNSGSVHVIADVQGYYSDVSGSGYTGLSPARILDTRTGTGGISGTVGPGQTISVAVTGVGGVPSTGVSAVMLNVAVTQPSSASHLTVFPSGISPPSTANLNFAAGQTTSNLVVAKVGSNGRVSVLNNSGSVHVIADVQGLYGEATGQAASSSAESSTGGTTPEPSGDTNPGGGANDTEPAGDARPGEETSPQPSPVLNVGVKITPPGSDRSVGVNAQLPLPIAGRPKAPD